MSRTIDFSLNSSNNNGKITGFNYSKNLNELAGSWSATVANGEFTAGDTINFSSVMSNGIISKAYKDADGLWHIEGRDAGIRLMRTTPQLSLLPTGNAKAVISDLASFCNIPVSMSIDGLNDFNVRSLITGSTCAEAILELAMLSGLIAYINNTGTLVIAPPSDIEPEFNIVLDNSGSDIDLDGYATQATVVVTRRKEKTVSTTELDTHYSGTTPSTSPVENTSSGTFSYTGADNKIVTGSYSITTLSPFGVIKSVRCSVTHDNITVETTENHSYDWKSKTVWRGNQEYVLFAYCETGYTTTRKTSGSYQNPNNTKNTNVPFTESTQEVMTRSRSAFNADWVPVDWENSLEMINREEYTRSTIRTQAKNPTNNMPSYTPPFDSKIIRSFDKTDFGMGIVCSELEINYEARQVGTVAPVKHNNEAVPHFMLNSDLAIQTHSTPEWVRIETYRTYYERLNNDGECEISTKAEWSDDGARWLLENAIIPNDDDEQTEYQQDYAKFSQKTHKLDISLKGGGISSSIWQFLELKGRTKTISEINNNDVNLNTQDWYDNGQYVKSIICPHYDATQKSCNIYGISAVGDFEGQKCPYYGKNWSACVRAGAALEKARAEYDTPLLEAPIIGIKNIDTLKTNPAVGYQREIYIDDIITNEKAQIIADKIAGNILKIKNLKGILKTVVIPYNPDYQPNGQIVSVSHDWENMQTTINYRVSGTIPDFMIPASVAGIASIISDRDAGRRTRPMSGTITAISNEGVVTVQIGGISYQCDTKLLNLGTGDAVLVSFTSGNNLRGQIIERL